MLYIKKLRFVFVVYSLGFYTIIALGQEIKNKAALFNFDNDFNAILQVQNTLDYRKGVQLAQARQDYPKVKWSDQAAQDFIEFPKSEVVAVAQLNLEILNSNDEKKLGNGNTDINFSSNLENIVIENGYDDNKYLQANFNVHGNLNMVIGKSSKMGLLNFEGKMYNIRHLVDDYYTFNSIKETESQDRNDEDVLINVNSDDTLNDQAFNCDNAESAVHEINLAVGYTQMAYKKALENENIEIYGLSQLAAMFTNTTLQTSQINSKVILNKLEQIDYVEEDSNITNIQNLINGTDGLSVLHEWRKETKSDVAILIVHNDNPSTCGRAAGINVNSSNAFAVVNWQCMNTKHSYAHELGHLIGARHNNDSSNPKHAHGYITSVDNRPIGTIMSTQSTCKADDKCWRSWYWSNPNVIHENVRMGKVNTNNNACEWKRNAKRIAKYGDNL
jgi:hypothetical protein